MCHRSSGSVFSDYAKVLSASKGPLSDVRFSPVTFLPHSCPKHVQTTPTVSEMEPLANLVAFMPFGRGKLRQSWPLLRYIESMAVFAKEYCGMARPRMANALASCFPRGRFNSQVMDYSQQTSAPGRLGAKGSHRTRRSLLNGESEAFRYHSIVPLDHFYFQYLFFYSFQHQHPCKGGVALCASPPPYKASALIGPPRGFVARFSNSSVRCPDSASAHNGRLFSDRGPLSGVLGTAHKFSPFCC